MIIYIDMDDVLADSRKSLTAISGMRNYKDIPQDYLWEVCATKNFFYNLEKTSACDKLIESVVDLFGSYHILSTPTPLNYSDSIRQKVDWIEENLAIQPKSRIFTRNKKNWANPGSLLIDDYGANIDAFKANHGYAIKFKHDSKNYNVDDVIKQLELLSSWEQNYGHTSYTGL